MQIKKNQKVERWRNFLEIVFLTFILALFLRTFIMSSYRVITPSMSPTLIAGDFVLISKISYGFKIPYMNTRIGESLPSNGDLVLYTSPDRPRTKLVKRVIGLPGDHILIRGTQIYVNEVPLKLEPFKFPLEQDYIKSKSSLYFKESNSIRTYPVSYSDLLDKNKEIGPFVVPMGEVFLLSDNRTVIDDLRYWEMASMDNVEGKLQFLWLSIELLDADAILKLKVRWDRITFQL